MSLSKRYIDNRERESEISLPVKRTLQIGNIMNPVCHNLLDTLRETLMSAIQIIG